MFTFFFPSHVMDVLVIAEPFSRDEILHVLHIRTWNTTPTRSPPIHLWMSVTVMELLVATSELLMELTPAQADALIYLETALQKGVLHGSEALRNRSPFKRCIKCRSTDYPSYVRVGATLFITCAVVIDASGISLCVVTIEHE